MVNALPLQWPPITAFWEERFSFISVSGGEKSWHPTCSPLLSCRVVSLHLEGINVQASRMPSG